MLERARLTVASLSNARFFSGSHFWAAFLAGFFGLGFVFLLGGYAFGGNFQIQLIGFILGLITSTCWLIWRWGIWHDSLPRTGLERALGLGLVVLLGALAVSPDARQGIFRVSSLAGCILLFYLFLNLFSAGLDRKGMLAGLIAANALLLVQALAETLMWYRSWFDASGGLALPPAQYRFVGILMSTPTMAVSNLFVFVVLITFWRIRLRLVRLSCLLWLVLFGLAVPFSSSRTAWVGLAAGLATGVALLAWETHPWRMISTWSKKKIWLAASSAVLLTLIVVFMATQFVTIFASDASHSGDPFGASGRQQFYAGAVAMWKQAPWLGIGPGRFGFEYMQIETGIPPGFWPVQAHNIFFQALAETGILGFASLLFFLLTIGRWGWRLYRQSRPEIRPWIGGILAGLTALFVENLFDDLTTWMAVAVPAVLLAAWISSTRQGQSPIFKRVSLGWLALPTSILVITAGWSLWAYQPLTAWLELARSGDWRGAAQQASESARRDPTFHFYQTEAGLLWAWEWDNIKDPAGLARARMYLQSALKIEPAQTWILANLAVLDAAAGDLPLAIQRLQQAIRHSPQMASYFWNLGKFYESSGDPAAAMESYRKVLDLDPTWASLGFWMETSTRLSAVSAWKAQKSGPDSSSPAYWQLSTLAAENGDLNSADRLLAKGKVLGEPQLQLAQTAVFLADLHGDPAAAQQARANLNSIAWRESLNLDPGIAFFYPAFVSNRESIGRTTVPGFLPDFTNLQ